MQERGGLEAMLYIYTWTKQSWKMRRRSFPRTDGSEEEADLTVFLTINSAPGQEPA